MEDKRKLLNDFLTAFPLETLSEMPLDKYTNLNRSESFCYWVESRTQELGSIGAGSAYKFGIYKYNEKPKGISAGVMCDVGNAVGQIYQPKQIGIVLLLG